MAQWFLTRNQSRYGPYTVEQMRQMVAARQVMPSDLIWSEGMPAWKPAGQVAAIFSATPDPAIPSVLPADSAVVPAAVAVPAVPAAVVPAPRPVQPASRPGPVNEPGATSETGEYDPGQFQRCRAGLTQAGIDLGQLVFFCATKTVKPTGVGDGVYRILPAPDSFKPICHLALCKRELAVVSLDEKGHVTADRAPLDLLDWSFAEAANNGEEVFALRLSTGELELRLNTGSGLTRFKELLAETIAALIREHIAAGRVSEAKSLLERLNRLPSARSADALRQQIGDAPKTAATNYAPRVVGCPRCGSKLRANRPGILQCPSCQAKVRAAAALFQPSLELR